MLNELNLTPELLEKAKSATSAAELLAFAQENGITITTDEATLYFAQLHPKAGELSDEELDNVAGGGLCDSDPNKYLAINYVQANYCDKNPRCAACQTSGRTHFDFLKVPKVKGKLCPNCGCKALIDAHCISMGWPAAEVAVSLDTYGS